MITGRADTDAKKRDVLEHIYDVWTANPELRLGQLLGNALYAHFKDDANNPWTNAPLTNLFLIEDYALVDMLERFK